MVDCPDRFGVPGCVTRADGTTENILVATLVGDNAAGTTGAQYHLFDESGAAITLAAGDSWSLGACVAVPPVTDCGSSEPSPLTIPADLMDGSALSWWSLASLDGNDYGDAGPFVGTFPWTYTGPATGGSPYPAFKWGMGGAAAGRVCADAVLTRVAVEYTFTPLNDRDADNCDWLFAGTNNGAAVPVTVTATPLSGPFYGPAGYCTATSPIGVQDTVTIEFDAGSLTPADLENLRFEIGQQSQDQIQVDSVNWIIEFTVEPGDCVAFENVPVVAVPCPIKIDGPVEVFLTPECAETTTTEVVCLVNDLPGHGLVSGDQVLFVRKDNCEGFLSGTYWTLPDNAGASTQITDLIETEACDPSPVSETLQNCIRDADGVQWTQIIIIDPQTGSPIGGAVFISIATATIGTPAGEPDQWSSCSTTCLTPMGKERCYASEAVLTAAYADTDNNTDLSFSHNLTTLKWESQVPGGDGSPAFTLAIVDCINSGEVATITLTDFSSNVTTFAATGIVSNGNGDGTGDYAFSGTSGVSHSAKLSSATLTCGSGAATAGMACQFYDCDSGQYVWLDSNTASIVDPAIILDECPPPCPTEVVQAVVCAEEAVGAIGIGDQLIQIIERDCNRVVVNTALYTLTGTLVTDSVLVGDCSPQPDIETVQRCIVDAQGAQWTQFIVVDDVGTPISAAIYVNVETLEIGTPAGEQASWTPCSDCDCQLIEGCILVEGEHVNAFTIVDGSGAALFAPIAKTTLGFVEDCCATPEGAIKAILGNEVVVGGDMRAVTSIEALAKGSSTVLATATVTAAVFDAARKTTRLTLSAAVEASATYVRRAAQKIATKGGV